MLSDSLPQLLNMFKDVEFSGHHVTCVTMSRPHSDLTMMPSMSYLYIEEKEYFLLLVLN